MALIRSAVLLVLAAFAASAGPITWTLNNVTLLGTSITGSFVYDADTSTHSSIDIIAQGGNIIPSASFARETTCCFGNPFGLTVVDTLAINQAGADALVLYFPFSLTDAGGSHSVFVYEGICLESNCLNLSNPTTGSYTGTVDSGPTTPEPSTFLIGGFALVFVTLRRQFVLARRSVPADGRIRAVPARWVNQEEL